jgi:hypothetical protein
MRFTCYKHADELEITVRMWKLTPALLVIWVKKLRSLKIVWTEYTQVIF